MRSWPGQRASRWIALLVLCLASPAAQAGEGLLGVFFDSYGQSCAGSVPPASYTTLYVVLQPGGSTSSGITVAEFRIDTSGASGYMFANEAQPSGAIKLGSALAGGCNVAFSSCQSGAIEVLSFQVLNGGTGSADGVVRIVARQSPTNPSFTCQLAVLCDAPEYTAVCVDAGFALMNPSGSRSCAGGRLPAEWSQVKELYRP